MSVLSIRNLPVDVEAALVKEAKRRRATKTQIVIEALQRVFGLGAEAKRRKKIREFFGKMTREEYRSFQEVTHDFSQPDEDIWK